MNNKIRIKFGQIEFEAEGDSDLIERERQQFFSLLPTAISAVTPIVADLSVSESANYEDANIIQEIKNTKESIFLNEVKAQSKIYESLAELINEKKFVNNVDLLMGVAYYLDTIKGISPFNNDDIATELSLARQPKLSNIGSFMSSNVSKALIIEEPKKKGSKRTYKISAKGIGFVETYVSKPENKKKNSKNKVTKQNYESKYLNITREELNLDKYPNIKKLNKFKEKMIMIMYIFMKEEKGEYFNVKDILSIMPHIFGENATEKQVAGVLRRESHWFNKVADTNAKKAFKYKLLNGGIDYAENLVMTIEANHNTVDEN